MSFGSPNKDSNCEGKISVCKKNKWPYKKYGNFKSMFFFSFSPTFLCCSRWLKKVVNWLKMLRKRKFRELKTADEDKAMLEKSSPKSTRYVTNWSFSILHSGKMQG